jgi:hypothetical protein
MIFGKKVFERKICVLIFSKTLFETLLIPRSTQRDIDIHVKTSSCKIPAISNRILMKLEFSGQSSEKKKLKY